MCKHVALYFQIYGNKIGNIFEYSKFVHIILFESDVQRGNVTPRRKTENRYSDPTLATFLFNEKK